MGISKKPSEIFFTQEIEKNLSEIIEGYKPGKVFLVQEEMVGKACFPLIQDFVAKKGIKVFTIPAGEQNKKIESVATIWEFLSNNGADRKSLQINLGGGMLTDLAGFAASTFKRGFDFVNIPTTLLSQVDASVGGKTGINFNGLKNEVGTFREPKTVLIYVDFLKTIDHENFVSGYAEMIKHGLIKSPGHLAELKEFDVDTPDLRKLEEMIRHSVEIKKYFVEADPTEKGIRKALNFGHTVGHAFESFAMKKHRPILHGYAVAYGMTAELFLSLLKTGFPEKELNDLAGWLKKIFGKFEFGSADFDELYGLMTHDKKNESGQVNFTLMPKAGEVAIDKVCSKEEIFEALDFYQSIQI